jgi:hypothetical protein
MVAALMGVGTAFASSTINLNTNNLASLGQGVATVSGCDSDINVSPVAGVDLSSETPEFKLTSIDFSEIDTRAKNTDDKSLDFGKGCATQALKIQVFQRIAEREDPTHPKAITCLNLIDSPLTVAGLAKDLSGYRESTDGTGCEIWVKIMSNDSTTGDYSKFTITGLKFAGDLSHITVVSAEDYPTGLL